MKKRLLTLALAICVLAPMTLSARAFDFNLGATAQFQQDVSNSDPAVEDLTDLDNYRFGAETRLNFLLLEVTDTALFGSANTSTSGTIDAVEFTNHLTGGVYMDLLNIVRVGLGAGPQLEMQLSSDGVKDSNGDSFTVESFFTTPNFTYKAHVDVLLGETLTLSATYTLPTSFNLDNMDLTKLIPDGSNWDEGRVGVSLLLF
jgi:hypothetical protein